MAPEKLSSTRSPHQRIVAFYESRWPRKPEDIGFEEKHMQLVDGSTVSVTRYEMHRINQEGEQYLSDTIQVRIHGPHTNFPRSTEFSIDQYGLLGIDIHDVELFKFRKSSSRAANVKKRILAAADELTGEDRQQFQAMDIDAIDWFERAIREDSYYMPNLEFSMGQPSLRTISIHAFMNYALHFGTVHPEEYRRQLQEFGLPEPNEEEVAFVGRNIRQPEEKKQKPREPDLWPKPKDSNSPQGEPPKLAP